MGLSYKSVASKNASPFSDGKEIYVTKTGVGGGDIGDGSTDDFNDITVSHDRYFGVTSFSSKNIAKSGLIIQPGGYSSVREIMPVTAFLQERVDIAYKYSKEVAQRVFFTR